MPVSTKNPKNLSEEKISPFLKWAGGKRWLMYDHPHLFPSKFNRYIEPFLGGGAIFFDLAPENAILSDLNQELIQTYEALKSSWEKVENILWQHHNKHDKEYYYKIRSSNPTSLHGKAAKFIYLNRTCWNGLYRVNLKGEFNVPIGTKKNVILENDNFKNVSSILKNVQLLAYDFEDVIGLSKKGDFVFIDPPYTVKHNYNNFIKYNEKLFSWKDQVRLKKAVESAVKRGAKVLVLNANHESVRELYKNFGSQTTISRKSVLAADPQKRGIFEELAIRAW